MELTLSKTAIFCTICMLHMCVVEHIPSTVYFYNYYQLQLSVFLTKKCPVLHFSLLAL